MVRFKFRNFGTWLKGALRNKGEPAGLSDRVCWPLDNEEL